MLPAGQPTDATVAELGGLLERGDTIIDGGNSFYRDDIRRAKALAAKGVAYVDIGTSGGVWGLTRGYCMMVGGEAKAVKRLDPILKTLAPGAGTIPKTRRAKGADPRAVQGYIHAGPVGAGHFVKMIHNGIEYGLMQAYAEGFELLEASELVTDVPATIRAWQRGTVVRSWLLDLLINALDSDPELDDLRGYVEDSGEGRWTVQEAINHSVPAPVISAALFARFASRQEDSPAMRAVAALRNQFGGHAVHTAGPSSGSGSTQ
jgi:6-phosphogluconate dehydrogenase